MTQLRYASTPTETIQRAASHAELVSRQARDIARLVKRLVHANAAIAVDQPYQQAVFSGIAHVSVLQADLRHRMKRLEIVLKELNAIGRFLRPSGTPAYSGGNVVCLSQRRLQRHGADRVVADVAARLNDLCGEIDLLNQTIESGLRTLSDLIHR